jgi:hypothetical protein
MVGAGVVDQIRRIRGKQYRPLVVHYADNVIHLGAVAAQKPMVAEQPEIARPRDWVQRRLGDDVLACEATVAAVKRRQQLIEFLLVETGEVEIEAGSVQRVQFGREEFLIPGTCENQLVVSDAVRTHLLGTEMRQPNDRDLGETQVAGRQQPSMAGDHLAVLGDQQGHGPAVAGDRRRDLRHLSIGVHPRIALVRLQARDRPTLDLLGQETQRGHRSWPSISDVG